MSSKLSKLLGLTAEDQESIEKTTVNIKSVAEFISDIVEACEDKDWLSKLSEICPWWLQIIGESASAAAPPIKFVATLFSKLGEIKDPDRLTYLAFTTAYQRAIEKSLKTIGNPSVKSEKIEWDPNKDIDLPKEGASFSTYSLSDPLNHTFIKQADAILDEALKAVGYNESERRKVHNEVSMRFPRELIVLLTHPSTRDKFISITEAFHFENPERVDAAWQDHFEYQRYLYEDKQVFGEEPFTLSDVYIETECGVLQWQEIQDGKLIDNNQAKESVQQGKVRIDPFDLHVGGQHELLPTVMQLIGDKSFKDAIVIQGPAGSGKSAFTLRLSVELLNNGLKPIRIRFRDLPLHIGNIQDALPEAIRFWDIEDRPTETPKAKPDELFADQSLFDQQVDFNGCPICPWVLIIDGWDEVSVAVEKGFAIRVNDILSQIRDKFINRGNRPVVRVVLTGRPSDAVSSSSFMTKTTRLFTIRPLPPSKLDGFVCRLARYFTDPKQLEMANPERFKPVLEGYRTGYQQLLENKRNNIERDIDTMEVLGLPLLAHLAVRLMVCWVGSDLQVLVNNPTTLYRHLTDITCIKGGRYGQGVYEPKLPTTELRRLLHETAVSMTVFGLDHIPYDELDYRLSALDEELIQRVQETTKDHPLTVLMIGFFFKGGHRELGAEFLHKSFREYLFAECLVETLKAYGRGAPDYLPERSVFWKDFDLEDIRFGFSRRLSQMLAPQWITKEVAKHVHALIEWELARTYDEHDKTIVGQPTQALDIRAWQKVRDGLADLWDWWGEAVHLRMQPKYQGKKRTGWENPYVMELVEWTMPQAPDKEQSLFPPRTTAIDSHLGDGLCRLTALVHHYVAVPPGIEAKWGESHSVNNIEVRRYQSIGSIGGNNQIRFKPSGDNSHYFSNYVARINSAGWRPEYYFPISLFLDSADFTDVSVENCIFFSTSLVGSKFMNAQLIDTVFVNANLRYSNFREAYATRASFDNANLSDADLSRIIIQNASFKGALIKNTRLDNIEGKIDVE
ncbi:pentapeptide repeat-containing protein [Methylomonas sp. AM2-LC]|uniref:pentapeptide repeat-containing protein n=1 Tax=Methylomonas sp. AM2-LC TaxID=3153301 RepID=UPI00326745AF